MTCCLDPKLKSKNSTRIYQSKVSTNVYSILKKSTQFYLPKNSTKFYHHKISTDIYPVPKKSTRFHLPENSTKFY